MLGRLLVAGGVVGAIGYILAVTGWSHTLNGTWQDALQRGLPRDASYSPVLLVEGSDDTDAGTVAAAVQQLGALGADRIGVLIETPVAREREVVSGQTLVRAWPVQPPDKKDGRWRLPPAAPSQAVVHALAAGEGPFHRRQPWRIATQAGKRPTVEAVMAADAGAETGAAYRVDYRGGLASLPRARLSDAAAGDVLAAMVRDRHVLIAPGSPWDRPRYDAPIAGPGVTDAQLHAFALRTLLEGRPLGAVPPYVAALVACLAALAGGVGAARLAAPAVAIHLGALLGFVVVTCVGVAWATGWLLPGIELLVAVLLPAAAFFYQRERAEDALLGRLATAASTRARSRDLGAAHQHGQGAPLLAHLITTGIGVSRTVVLATDARGHFSAVAGAAVDADRVAASYGDDQRPPFDTPMSANTPVAVSAPLLGEAGPGASDYLARLVYGGITVGYWVFTLDEGTPDAEELARHTAPVFAERLAELLHLARPGSGQRRGWRALAGGPGGKALSGALAQSLSASERRLALFEEVLARQETAIAVYDILGQPVHINRAMLAVGDQAGLETQGATATDLLTSLAGLDAERARAFHRQAVAHDTPVSFPLPEPIGGRHYMLGMVPLSPEHPDPDSLFTSGSHSERRNDGFLISLSDYTSAANLFNLSASLHRFINTRLRNDLINIQFASDLLVDPRLAEPRRERAAALLRKAIARADDELDLLDDELSRQTSEGGDVNPIDTVMVLHQVLADVKASADERGVAVRLDVPSFSTPALARPGELHEALRAALELVIDGASPGAEMVISYREDDASVTTETRADGYGMPDERLQRMLTRPELDEPVGAAGIRAAREHLRAWGGELTAAAGLGEGVGVRLTLQRAARASDDTSSKRGGAP